MSNANVERVLNAIEALADVPAGMSLGALAERLDVPKSAAHRLLQSLIGRGYVTQDAPTQDYLLSLKVPLLGFRYLEARRLPDVAQGVLDHLAQATGEYCRMAVVEGEGLHWVARAQGATQGLRYDPPMGRDVVLHATATGKSWLATLPEQDALRIVFARGFATPPGFGDRVVKTADELRRHLRDTRLRGYALALEEGEPGTIAIAAVFRAYARPDAPAAGTISVAGPRARLSDARIVEVSPLLRAATDAVTELWPLRLRQTASRDGAAPITSSSALIASAT